MAQNTLIYIIIFIIVLYLFRNKKEMKNNNKENMDNDTYMILYYASWCSHCQHFKPTWEEFVKENVISTETIQCDLDENKEYCKNVPGYPYVVLVKNGEQIHYTGPRTVDELKNFVKQHK